MSATEKLAELIGCRTNEIIYTSGGTESNNLALLGAAEALSKRDGMILTTPYEHPSVLEPLRYIKSKGWLDVIETPVSEWTNFLYNNCVLASCSQVNHETGEVNDINKIASLIKEVNRKIIFHSDGVQGFCKTAMPSEDVDLYSFSAHKFFGPPGIGGLIVRQGTPTRPLMFGGGQQNSLRPGTLNIPGILKMVEAAENAWNDQDMAREQTNKIKSIMMSITDELSNVFINANSQKKIFTAINTASSDIPFTSIVTNPSKVISSSETTYPLEISPFILNMSFIGIRGETLVHMLSEHGVLASMGAACRTRKKEISPLEKMGYSKERAESAVRFSFGYNNTEAEAYTAKAEIIKCVTELRSVKQNKK